MTPLLDFAVSAGIARLTFDNPRRLNAINAEMWRALPGLMARVQEDSAVRVLVLQGAGDRAFCSGNDISEFETIRADPAAAAAYNAWQHDVAQAFRGLTKPSIAAIHGHCLGAGLELALMCDMRACTPDAAFGVPAVKLGLPYRLVDIRTLVDVLGLARTREMVLLGRSYGGRDAERMGLVNWLVADRAALEATVATAAAEMAAHAPLSLAAARVAFQELTRHDGPPDLTRAKDYADRCYASSDYAEGRLARREKRTPRFEGR
jgi:enoyl-CoA hydratase